MISVIAIGRIKEKASQDLIKEYEKRMKPIHDLECIELPNSKKTSTQEIVDDESKRILEKISQEDYLILLDISGKNFSSEMLADKLEALLNTHKRIVFVIGGSHGVSDELRHRAQLRWSLSHLTFPHQLVRILLYEQIYRLFMIKNKHPYHK